MKRVQFNRPVTYLHDMKLNDGLRIENVGGTNDAFWYLQDAVA